MKKLLTVLACLALTLFNVAYADGTANLRMKISGPIHDNTYYLCLTDAGCLSMQMGDQGRVFPIDTGNVGNIFTTNMANRRIYAQALPASCNVDLKENQTMTVSGRLVAGANDKVYIQNLNCTVTG